MVDLQKEREKQKITQEELAARIGVSRQSLSAIERGITLPSVENAKKIAAVLNIRWSDFYEETSSAISQ